MWSKNTRQISAKKSVAFVLNCKAGFLACAICLSLAACQTTGGSHFNSAKSGLSSSVSASYDQPAYKSKDDFVNAMLEAADIAQNENKYSEMEVFLGKAFEKESESEHVAWRYARALRLNQNAAQAVKILTPYIVRTNPLGVTLREYAASMVVEGNAAKAAPVIDRLLKRNNISAKTWNVAGVVADANGDLDLAIKRFQNGLLLVESGDERQKSVLLSNMALAMVQKNDISSAKTALKGAMTGAQYFPQIEQNYLLVQDLPNGKTAIKNSATKAKQAVMDKNGDVMIAPLPSAKPRHILD